MGIFSKHKHPRWVDTDALKWTPDAPFVYAKVAEAAPVERAPVRPRAEAPAAPIVSSRPDRLWLPRMAIGLAQGVGLFALVQSRSAHQWPGDDGYIFAAVSLAGLFAPLALLEGLGEIPPRLLGWWTGIAAAVIAGLGLYHHWRIDGGAPSHAGLALVTLIALALFVGQAMLRAGVRDRKIIAGYRSCFDTSWTLAARLLIWAGITAIVWALVGSGNSLANWLRSHYPDFQQVIDPSQLILPLVGLASAGGFALTAGTSAPRLACRMLLACFTIALPVFIAISVGLLAVHLFVAAQPLWALLVLGLFLLISFNASYRAGAARSKWRRVSEIAAAFAMVALMACAALALHIRVAADGWTQMRIDGALTVAVLGLYGLAYSCSGLISIGGGAWMQKIEPANRALAIGVFVGAILLCTPLADPLAIAVQAQAARLQTDADPAVFDFAWLNHEGLRFGHAALTQMAAGTSPEVARDAAMALTTPVADGPPPSQIGANITVRTPGARLPNSLLDRDWSKVAGTVPPCLTHTAFACDAWFLDLDHDGAPEILLAYGTDARWWASVMKRGFDGGWNPVASFASPTCHGTLTAMRKGNLYIVDPAPTWQDLLVAGVRLTAKPGPKPDLPCPR